MKKITIIIALFLVSIQGNSQLLAENFDTALTWTSARMSGTSTLAGWSRVTAGTAPTCTPFAGAGMARFDSYNVPAGNTYRLTSPAITFAGASYKVKFKMYRDGGYNTYADNIKVYYNTTATTTGATLLGTVNRSIDLTPVVTAEGWYSYDFNLPAAVTGVGYISFLAASAYGNNMFIDSVSVGQTLANDGELTSVNMDSILPSTAIGNNSITGSIKNFGLNVINSVVLNWQIDAGAIYTQTITGLNIAPGASYNYNHTNQWNALPGLYTLKVWIGNDDDLTNNLITRQVAVASNQTARLPLYEKFSSSTCGPCAGFNINTFSGFSSANAGNFAAISYQVNWPGSGDPYYTAEVGTRRGYYSVSAAPSLFVDGKDGMSNAAGLQTNLNAARLKPAYFLLNSTKDLVGNTMTVNVDITPYLTGNYKLYVAVVEKLTTGNVGSNGETEWHNVFMKMMTSASGNNISCTAGNAIPTITLTQDLSGLFIEEMTDLEVIVFVQSATVDKTMMQSVFSSQALSNEQFEKISKIKLYPNPSNGIFKLNTETPVNVIVTDISGKVVAAITEITNEKSIDLTNLQKGIYFAKINDGNKEQTQKIIIK